MDRRGRAQRALSRLRARSARGWQQLRRPFDRRANGRNDTHPSRYDRARRRFFEPDPGGGMNVAVVAAPPPTLDPITVEVIGAALSSIVEETGEALIRASYSTNIKERRDCSTALFDVQGRTLCQAEHIPIHLGSFIGIVPHVLKHHAIADMRPGDVFVGNDAYAGGGTHLPDIVMVEPIFVDGTIVAWTVNLAHHADFADRGHAHIYQEGLRIPPIRLYRAGELQQDILDLILLNCQVPRERLTGLRARRAANRLFVQLVPLGWVESYAASSIDRGGP